MVALSNGKKPEVLSTSERLTSTTNIYKNIRAHMKLYGAEKVLVQNDCTIEPGVWEVTLTSKQFRDDILPELPYRVRKSKKN